MSSGVRTSSPAAPAVERPSVSAGSLWSGRILSPLVVLFLLFGGITKVMRISTVLAASVQLGLSETVIAALGVTLLVCSAFHARRFSSAVLPAGDLGDAVSIQLIPLRS